ncbi:helix-turn-helix domain-containing protein [Paenisporosarcina sp. OV554]|uniref:helix-turn-helix domain-containing protein n=1 Tax=Paenisporosarcina sp. OV554 TaxID=2135694 RepID=UPI000D388E55|nr:helix-turn-helix transcriptional regulator [Paenisporosarcina sp. OV554]PUB10640.1 helix-turn-helix protein [Paenisporosarcina sp. OV554]
MYEGKIIKFYRKKAKLTQEQLGKGVCSVTHISKIERGLTEYSPEITILLSKRLKINIEKELANLTNLKIKLDYWHEVIISQNMQEALRIYKELANNKLFEISEHIIYYDLLKAKYYLRQGDTKKAQKLIEQIQLNPNNLSVYETNLFKHILGLYYMSIDEHIKSIDIFNSIDYKNYSNPSVYYDLGAAYHNVHSPVLAYYYAEKALNYFKTTNHFLRIIDTENFMLIQVESDQYRNFKNTIEQYENLIKLCDLCNASDKKAKVLHNFAYEHLRRKKYQIAGRLYKESMELKDNKSTLYLLSLEGYISSGFKGKFLPKEELLRLVNEGMTIATENNEALYKVIFTLHQFSILQQEESYYSYLINNVLPYFKSHGYTMIAQSYDRDLYNYYIRIGNMEKALEIADIIINNELED